MARRKIGAPTPNAIDDMWQRRATAAAIVAVRELINAGGAIPPATPISRLSDIELGWFTAANLFAWIKCRSEQATAEGWNTELALRLTGLSPQTRGTLARWNRSCRISVNCKASIGRSRSRRGPRT